MQCHILIHIAATYFNIGYVEKMGLRHMETAAETQCEQQTEPNPNAIMWQFRNFHTAQREKQ
jgi:hypothetical protein